MSLVGLALLDTSVYPASETVRAREYESSKQEEMEEEEENEAGTAHSGGAAGGGGAVPSVAERDCFHRVQGFLNNMKAAQGLCHTGVRHEALMSLNKIYPGADFVIDVNFFILFCLKEGLKQVFLNWRGRDRVDYSRVMVAWGLREELPDTITLILAGIKKFIESQLRTKGINPEAYTAKIDEALEVSNVREYFPAAADDASRYLSHICLYEVDGLPSVLGGRVRALVEQAGVDLTDTQLINQLSLFSVVGKLITELRKYQAILTQLPRGQSITEEDIRLIHGYLSSYEACERLPEECDERDRALLEKAAEAIEVAKQDALEDWVANYFVRIQESESIERKQLSKQLNNPAYWNKIQIPDIWLETVFSGEEVHLRPYEINRILLHALRVAPVEWSELFAQRFHGVVEFINDKIRTESDAGGEALYRDSYAGLDREFMLLRAARPQSGGPALAVEPALDFPDFKAACDQNYTGLARAILALGLDLTRQFVLREGRFSIVGTALDYAIDSGHIDVIQDLPERAGPEVNVHKMIDSESLLGWAVRKGLVGIVRALCARSDVDMEQRQERFQDTPLVKAVVAGHSEIVQILLAVENIDVNHISESWGGSALHIAVRLGFVDIVRILLAHPKINPFMLDRSGDTILHLAADHVDLLRVFLDSIDVNTTNREGMTALHLAAQIS